MVGMSRTSRLTGFILVGASAAYSPFSGIEELSPRRLVDFCDPEAKAGIRHCHYSFQKRTEDGGDVKLHWTAKADPDRILSLDTEAAHGVRLLRCTPSSLELVLPESHARHAVRGHFVVGSYFVHNCEHLFNVKDHSDGSVEHRDLYHIVTKVKNVQWHDSEKKSAASRYAHVKLWTRELPSLAHMLPSLSFEFEYVPHEAREVVKWPKTRTAIVDDAHERKRVASGKELAEANARRLDKASGVGWSWDGGEPQHGGSNVIHDDINGLLDFTQKRVANFGWNWDFRLNSSKEASFNYTAPGTGCYVMFKKPYVKAHAGIYLKFRATMPLDGDPGESDEFFDDSKWPTTSTTSASPDDDSSEKKKDVSPDDFMAMWEPHVQWTAKIPGHGVLQARMIAQMLSRGDIMQNPLSFIQLPIFEDLRNTKWFGTMNFALGHMPVSISPGFQFKAKFFHTGIMRGTINLGVITHAKFEPRLDFDSHHGLRADLKLDTKDTTFWPPNWMVSTGHFAMGLALEPSFWLKGWFLKHQQDDTKIALDLRPYLNVSITRHGHKRIPGEERKEVIVYPFRITGLDSKKFTHKYVVQVEGDAGFQRTLKTKPAMNWGMVEYHDSAADFTFGLMREKELLTKRFAITLIEVVETEDQLHPKEIGRSPSVQVLCHSLLNGVCHPSPEVEIPWKDSKIKLYVHIVWQDNPLPWFSQRLRGVSASFPGVIIDEEYEEAKDSSGKFKDMSLVLVHDSIRYPVPVVPVKTEHSSARFRGESIIEFGPTFLSTWRPTCSSQEWCDPMIELWIGDKHVSSAAIPEIPWNSHSRMSGTYKKADVNVGHNEVPVSVSMKPLSSSSESTNGGRKIAVIRMMFSVANPSMWNRFVAPYKMIEVNLGKSYTLRWSCASKAQRKFSVRLMERLSPSEASHQEDLHLMTMVGKGTPFTEVNGTAKDLHIQPMESKFNEYAINVFEYKITLDEQRFKANDEIVAALQWVDVAGITHKMNSNPIVILPASAPVSWDSTETGRGEAADEALEDMLPMEGLDTDRRLKGLADLNKDGIPDEREYTGSDKMVMQEKVRAPECAKQDLNFGIGAGLLIRGRVAHLALPMEVPQLDLFADEPAVALPWKNIVSWNSNEKDFKDLLPELLCRGGACESTVPGCSEAGHSEKKYWPELHIHWNKAFTFDQSEDRKIREAWETIRKIMAYGFAVLPEAINIVTHAANGSHTPLFNASSWHNPLLDNREQGPHRHNVQSGEVACEGHNFDSQTCGSIGCCMFSSADEKCHSAVGPGPCYKEEPPVPQSSNVGLKLPATPQSPTASLGRRLRSSGDEHKATVTFNEGLSYRLDRRLMDEMLRRGLFNFDDHDNNDLNHPIHGLRIQSYEITDGNAREGKFEEADLREASKTTKALNFASSVQGGILFSAIGSAAVLGVVALQRYRNRNYEPVTSQGMQMSTEEDAIE